jgi:hypothetical protein
MTKTYQVAIVLCGLAVGCGDGSKDERAESGILPTLGGSSGETGDESDDEEGPGNGPGGENTSDGNDEGGPKYDVGQGGANFCMDKTAGVYCNANAAVECDDSGNEVSNTNCIPDICEEGQGCVECLAGQFDCMGAAVYSCNAAVNPPVWEQVEVCDPAAGMGCDIALGTCVPLAPLGGTTPTGVYYQYADFQTSAGVYLGGYDVDSFEDLLYVSGSGGGVDVYRVQLLDSDGDGMLEPNQHPDNPDDMGPIEERTLTFVENIPYAGELSGSVTEIFAAEDRLFAAGGDIDEYIFASGAVATITAAPSWASRFSQMGYDDVNGVWYASNENQRRVFQHDAATDTWGLAFYYPELAGDHMDGIEVVTDPETGIPYVYVSDMTSDFIGQYRKDPDVGWVQQNLFSYQGTAGAPVEGMGFGALNHFWATAGNSVYEVGGGDLAEFTEPPG